MVSVAAGTLMATTFALLTVLDHAAGSGFGGPEVKGEKMLPWGPLPPGLSRFRKAGRDGFL